MAIKAATPVIPANQVPKLNYLTNGYGLKSWLLTTDHKRIAILYLISVSAFFFLGGFLPPTVLGAPSPLPSEKK